VTHIGSPVDAGELVNRHFPNLRLRPAWPVNRWIPVPHRLEVHWTRTRTTRTSSGKRPILRKWTSLRTVGPAKAGFLLRTHSHSKKAGPTS